MKIAFCIDDKPQYLILLKVAVRSLRKLYGDEAPECVCVYAGSDESIMQAVKDEGITLARYTPVLSPDVIPSKFHYAIGCFLKLELALLPELADQDRVLYCDTDVVFHRRFDELFELVPPYMAMAREQTAPFFHDHESLDYKYRGRRYVVKMPFPIWTFSSGVVVFNLERLRKNDYIHNFLAFCRGTMDRIGNLDQSLLNYFFGKRVTKLEQHFNMPPYMVPCLDEARIVHYHGAKPWEFNAERLKDLHINHYDHFRSVWYDFLTDEEREAVREWE